MKNTATDLVQEIKELAEKAKIQGKDDLAYILDYIAIAESLNIVNRLHQYTSPFIESELSRIEQILKQLT